MKMTQTLLVEIFTEELPPKALGKLETAFSEEIIGGLRNRGLLASNAPRKSFFATPRRLAALIPDVLPKSADQPTRLKVLPVSVAIDARGNPTQALAKKLVALGFPKLTVEDLERAQDGKTESFFYTYTAPGVSLAEALQAILADTVATLPIPKVMRYQTGAGDDVEFVRPAHGLVALHGADVVPVSVLGLTAGRTTHGHRFQGAKDIELKHADEYESRLGEEGGVIAGFTARRAEIERQLNERASALGADLKLAERDALLDEVTALVEMPTVYVGEFEPEFLAVPQECLILTMQANQKYFPLFDGDGKLLNKFLIVSNMGLDNPKNIVEGNQRVIRPRLADARFFYEQDCKTKLEARLPKLGGVVYHNKLGSQLARALRIRKVAGEIAATIGASVPAAQRAAELCKTDLLTDMVAEFPELQGVMGEYYARHDGEQEDIATAIKEHYRPRFAGDALPGTRVALAVALADKVDTLVAIFGIGQAPTGDKDPFGLRRQALGVIRMLYELQLPLDLRGLLNSAHQALTDADIYRLASLKRAKDSETAPVPSSGGQRAQGFGYSVPAIDSGTVDAVFEFLLDRLRGYLREAGFEPGEIDAVVSQAPRRIDLVKPRIAAVRAFRLLPEAEALSAANKRTRNILKKADGLLTACNPALFAEGSEKQLHDSVMKLAPEVASRVAAQDYTGALKQLAGIRGDVDKFFDDVMVMADDPIVRANRLALLAQLEKLMNQVADISKLAA